MAMNVLRSLRPGDGETHEEAAPPPAERCLSCNANLSDSRMYERFRVCHSCEFHYQLNARERLALLLDPGTFHEDDRGVTAIDPLSFSSGRSYRRHVIEEQRRTQMTESAMTGTGSIFGREVVAAVLDFSFLGGSMGVASGERIARAFERAVSREAPIVTVVSTSGARMQEGLLALMQTPRVISAVREHHRAGLPHICVLANPATGSAFAGFPNLADYLVAEPGAQVGYSAYRTLQDAEGEKLAADVHTSEWMLQHGLIDAVVPRAQLRQSIGLVLDLLMNDYRLTAPKERRAHRSTHTHRGAWQLLQLSRHEKRPNAEEFIAHMTTAFVELHGDRGGKDDASIVAGIGSMGGEAVMLIGENRPHKRKNATDGWISPAGFRKAARAMKIAEKFQLPVITLIDTEGALPSLSSEATGLGNAIASSMATLLELTPPTVAVIIGEGNSEAAAALAVADRVLMLDNAVYTVMPPEEAARRAFPGEGNPEDIADALRMTSHDCLKLGIIDSTVPEPGDGAHTNHTEASLLVRRSILRALTDLRRTKPKKRLEKRRDRYRGIGSTRSAVRGRVERRLAHFIDRVELLFDRKRRRARKAQRDTYDDIVV